MSETPILLSSMELIVVDRIVSNDGVIRVELLACGHTVSLLSTERYAKRRRCCHCAIAGEPQT